MAFKISSRSGRIKAIVLVGFIVLGSCIYRASVFRPAKNFHVVDEGKFYRSAQLRGDEIEEIVAKYGIKTVINLRGSQPGEWWFDEEKSTLEKLGVRHENIGFSTEHLQTRDDIIAYNELLRTAERPILVHCRSGADRTGEASAIYAMDYMGKSREEALKQVSFQYLHVPLLQPAKRLFVSRYDGPEWAKSSYDPCSPELRKYAKHESYCR
jgi:uncharacterized protein (TIGR01244 family)